MSADYPSVKRCSCKQNTADAFNNSLGTVPWELSLFQLNLDIHFYWGWKTKYTGKSTNIPRVADTFY
jgi:hypothetical protein